MRPAMPARERRSRPSRLRRKRVSAPASSGRRSVLVTRPSLLQPIGNSASRYRPRTCQTPGMTLPDPALVVLVGASGSGKSTWAQARYRSEEIVSSDELRGIVGSGRHDLDASTDAFRLLDEIV